MQTKASQAQQAAQPDNGRSDGKGIRPKGQRRRKRIIEVAKQILIENGSDSLTLRDVAEQIGITHGNLQYYFPTKNDLLMAIFDQEVEKYTEGVKIAVSQSSTRKGRLDAIIDSGIAELKTPEVVLWYMMISLASHNPDMASILKKENDLYEKVVADELGVISPKLSVQRRRHIARIIHAILDGLGVQYSYEDPDSPEMRGLASEIKVALFAVLEVD